MAAKKLFFFLCFILVGFALSRSALTKANVFATTPFTVGVAGDFGPYPNTSFKTFQKIGKLNPNMFFAIGDFQYNTNPESGWCKMVKDNINLGAGRLAGDSFGETFPFELLSGDHEDGGDTRDGFIGNFLQCLPDRIGATVGPNGLFGYGDYYVDYPQASPTTRIIALAPLMNFSIPPGKFSFAKGDAHYNWASQTIDDARAKGITWIIVLNHENYITMGIKGNGVGADYFNLMLEKKVDLIFQGNDHNYQRSKQIALNPSTCPSIPSATAGPNANCLVDDGSDNSYVHGKGTVLVITGTGGIGHYNTNPLDVRAPYFAKWMGNSTSEVSYGYTQIQVTDTALNVNFVPSVGSFTDSFTIGLDGQSPPATLTPTATAAITPSPTAQTPSARMLIPLYSYPGTLWNQVISANTYKNIDVIINPANGVGASKNTNYSTWDAQLKTAGVGIYGYVYTGYGTRSLTIIKAEIDNWQLWYGVDGIFIDEASNTSAMVPYYTDLWNYITAKGMKVSLNPGTSTVESYTSVANTINLYENDPSSPLTVPSWVANYPAFKFGALQYAASVEQMRTFIADAKAKNIGFIYVTNDVLTNPWDGLPAYLAEEATLLANGGTATTPTPTPAINPGDANGDGKVDETDYGIWLSRFGQTVAGGASVGDFDGNGKVDGVDYVIWLTHYGS